MGTVKQKRIAQIIVENAKSKTPLNGGQIVEKGRYSKSMQIKPSKVLKSKGVQEELKILGFDPDSAKKVVVEIMENPLEGGDTRLRATDQIFKIHGSYAANKILHGHVDFGEYEEMSTQELRKIVARRNSGTASGN